MALMLNLGCGQKKMYGFTNVDIDESVCPDVVDDVFNLKKFDPNSVYLIYSCHVLEHCPRKDIEKTLSKWYELLKKGGTLRLAVPDFGKVCELYKSGHGELEDWLGFIVGGQRDEFDYHKCAFDEWSLRTKLDRLGFHSIRRWDWKTTYPHNYIDDYSQAYMFPKGDKINGVLCSLNMEATK